jgi:RNA-binding protein
MNNKQRSYLSGLASSENAIFQTGKSSLTPEVVAAVAEALDAR